MRKLLENKLTVILTFGILSMLSIKSSVRCDCIYSFHATGGTPCGVFISYSLIRSVKCSNGDTYDVCCDKELRPEIQANRQVWFRSVTGAGDPVSRQCTKSIMCRMSCKDSNREPRADYPELLQNDTTENKEYVDAFNGGVADCHHRDHNVTMCAKECNKKFPLCEKEKTRFILVRFYDNLAETLHIIGMYLFDAWWWLQDTVEKKHNLAVTSVSVKPN